MNNVVSVEPITSDFLITWNIGRRCNYDCMYCPSDVHSTKESHKDLKELKAIWYNILDKTNRDTYKICFTGGEVTSNKNFLPFVKWLKTSFNNKITSIILTTNGSASYEYYLELFDYVDNISFSTHSEHIVEKKFFDTVIRLSENIGNSKFIHVNIMDEYFNEQRIDDYKSLLDKHNISNIINKIDYNKKHRDTPVFKGKLDYEFK